MPILPTKLPSLLTIPEGAEHLRLCTKTVRKLIKTGALPAHRVGNQYRVDEKQVRAYLQRNDQQDR